MALHGIQRGTSNFTRGTPCPAGGGEAACTTLLPSRRRDEEQGGGLVQVLVALVLEHAGTSPTSV